MRLGDSPSIPRAACPYSYCTLTGTRVNDMANSRECLEHLLLIFGNQLAYNRGVGAGRSDFENRSILSGSSPG
jgi:hypothetical protein